MVREVMVREVILSFNQGLWKHPAGMVLSMDLARAAFSQDGPSSKGRLLLSYGSPSSGCHIVLVFIIDVPERSLVIGQS